MPPKSTRKTTATRNSQNQGTLAFGTQNKITKPSNASASASGIKKPLSKPALANIVDAVTTAKPATPTAYPNPNLNPSPPPQQTSSSSTSTSTSHPLRHRKQQPQPPKTHQPPTPLTTQLALPSSTLPPSTSTSYDTDEIQALLLPASHLANYWHLKESSRLAPRIHQQHLTLHEKILREFDLSTQYGPCIGISRLKRWKRARGLGLAPPREVLGVLMREREGEREREERERVGGKGRRGDSNGGKGEWDRAGIEGLLSGSSGMGSRGVEA